MQGKSLYKTLIAAVVFISLCVGILAIWGVKSFRNDAASMAVQNAVQQLSGTVSVLVNVLSESGERGQFDGLTNRQLQEKVLSVMKDRKMIAGILVSNDSGLELAMIRDGDSIAVGRPAKGNMSWSIAGTTVDAAEDSSLPLFDLAILEGRLHKERQSLKPGQYSWTSAYRFHGHGESWMTISWLAQGGRMFTFVMPIALVVNQLSHADRGEAEELFVYWESGKVMDIPRVENNESYREAVVPSELDDLVVAQATKMLADNQDLRGKTFKFRVDGKLWWAASQSLSAFGDTMYLGAAMPQSKVNTELTSDRFIYAFAVFIAVFSVLALYFLRRFRGRIEGLGLRRAYTTPDEIRALIAEGESDRLEFKQTLRFNLKSGKNGKEIETANLKTVAAFLNSDGGTLLVGVNDAGEPVGLEEDGFENEDRALLHFTNLLNKHIGVKYQPFINLRAVPVNEKYILRVNCVHSDEPAFLVNGQSEEFYVRSGPASRKLTVRQFYEFLRTSGKRRGENL